VVQVEQSVRCVCSDPVYFQTITFEVHELWPRYLACWFSSTLSGSSSNAAPFDTVHTWLPIGVPPYHFCDILRRWSKTANISYHTCFWHPHEVSCHWNPRRSLVCKIINNVSGLPAAVIASRCVQSFIHSFIHLYKMVDKPNMIKWWVKSWMLIEVTI